MDQQYSIWLDNIYNFLNPTLLPSNAQAPMSIPNRGPIPPATCARSTELLALPGKCLYKPSQVVLEGLLGVRGKIPAQKLLHAPGRRSARLSYPEIGFGYVSTPRQSRYPCSSRSSVALCFITAIRHSEVPGTVVE